MSDEALQDIIKRKNERIEDLEDKNQILFKQLYEAKQDLDRLKSILRNHVDNPDEVIDEDTAE